MEENNWNNYFKNTKTNLFKLLVIMFVSVSQILYCQVKFYKSYPSEGITYGQKIIQSDGYLIMTNTRNESDRTYDILLIKTDLSGDGIWSKQYDFYLDLVGIDFIKVDETGFLILGRHMKDDWLADIALIRINHNGDTLWTKLLDCSNYDFPQTIVKTNDGGFILTGNFFPEEENSDIFLMKSNANGEFLWLKSFGDSKYDIGMDVIQDNDGGFLITGDYRDNVNNAFLLKTNVNGDSVWMKKYFTSTESSSRSLIRTRDGGLMILGGITSASIIKTDNLGDILWTRQYNIGLSFSDYFYSIIQTDDNGYLIGGAIDITSSMPSTSAMAIVKLDSLGNIEWYRKYATNELFEKQAKDIIETENGYCVLGYTGLNFMWDTDERMYFISTDKNGCYIQDPIITGIDFFCSGGSTTLYATPDFNSYKWSTGAVSNPILISQSGEYSVQVIDTNDCPLWSDTYLVQEFPLPEVLIKPYGSTAICYGEKVRLSTVIQNYDFKKDYTYSWNNDLANTSNILVDTSGKYTINVEDKYGCHGSDSIVVVVHYPYQEEQICIVTIEMATGKNVIVWEKTPDVGVAAYNIYRESTIGVYNKIGTVPYDELSVFKDMTANPESQAYLYKITEEDTCGNESLLASTRYHRPSFLQYVSSEGGVNLEWTDYSIQCVADIGEFLTSYAIYRGTDSTGLEEYQVVGSINTYTDTDPDALKWRYYYRVAAILKEPCYPTIGKKADTGPYSHSMSNIEDNRIKIPEGMLRLNDSEFKIIPNPFSESTTLIFGNPERNPYTLYLTDLSGKVHRVVNDITTSEYVLEKGDLKEGFYFVELRGSQLFRGKIVIE